MLVAKDFFSIMVAYNVWTHKTIGFILLSNSKEYDRSDSFLFDYG